MNITISFDPDKKEDIARIIAILEPLGVFDAKQPSDADVPIDLLRDVFGLGTATCNVLRSHGCTTLSNAKVLTKKVALNMRGFGRKSWYELQDAIARFDNKKNTASEHTDNNARPL